MKAALQSSLSVEQLSGYRTVDKFRRILTDKLSARRAADIHPSEQDPRRTLGCDDFFTLLFFALYNPVLKSLRAITEASHFEKVREELSVDSGSLGRLSEAQHVFDPQLLREVFKDLSARLAFKPKTSDRRLEGIVKRMVAVVGPLFEALPRMAWPMYRPRIANQKVKLHLSFEPLRRGIEDAVVTEGNACERKALKKLIRAGKLYVGDRYHGLHYDYFKCFGQKRADFVFRIRTDAVYQVVESHPVGESARRYGVRLGLLDPLRWGHHRAPLAARADRTQGRDLPALDPSYRHRGGPHGIRRRRRTHARAAQKITPPPDRAPTTSRPRYACPGWPSSPGPDARQRPASRRNADPGPISVQPARAGGIRGF